MSKCLKDHPRLCGEKVRILLVTTSVLGSPPPMRGKGICRKDLKMRQRITPAYAGKSKSEQNPQNLNWDHPRLCGEKYLVQLTRLFVSGSPPPMRGKGPIRPCSTKSSRITPAYAGKRASAAETIPAGEDHPRLCGEKFFLR